MARYFHGIEIASRGDAGAGDANLLLEALDILRPRPAPRPLVRLGGQEDGAYLVPDDLEGIAACFSPGVNHVKWFEDELTDRFGIAAHMCDGGGEPNDLATPIRAGRQTIEKLWLDVPGAKNAVDLGTWVARHAPDPAADLLLQMDIEGAEYRNILATPDAVLERFRVIVLEMHDLFHMEDPAILRTVFLPFLRKLSGRHVCVHAHPNNAHGSMRALDGTDIPVPNLLEVTFLRRDRLAGAAEADLIPVSLPHPLDVRANSPSRPPVFLGDYWRGGHPADDGEVLRMLQADVRYLKERMGDEDPRDLAAKLDGLYDATASPRPAGTPSRGEIESLREVAGGKRYVVSSLAAVALRRGIAREGRVGPRAPFFFCTATEHEPWIKIDLDRAHDIEWIELRNRTDHHQGRARHVYLRLSDDPSFNDAVTIVARTGPGFARKNPSPSLTAIRGARARHVQVLLPGRTFLNLSAIRVFARPLDAA